MNRVLIFFCFLFSCVVTQATGIAHAADRQPGEVFSDCEGCPEMVVIPVGSFDMGQPASGVQAYDSAQPAHVVEIGAAYAIGKTEITRRQWRVVTGSNPASGEGCEDCPVENLSWDEAAYFVYRLAAKTGKLYRLPSEAEWEYACRAGGRQAYCGSDHADNVGWYKHNSGGKARPVARREANAFGLYDMSGNVWEWTADCWHNGYEGAPADGGAWGTEKCASRVIRGGSWQYDLRYAGATVRAGSTANTSGGSDGVRVVRSLP